MAQYRDRLWRCGIRAHRLIGMRSVCTSSLANLSQQQLMRTLMAHQRGSRIRNAQHISHRCYSSAQVIRHPTCSVHRSWYTPQRQYCTSNTPLTLKDERLARYVAHMKERHRAAASGLAEGRGSYEEVAVLQPLIDTVTKYETATAECHDLQTLLADLGANDAELRTEAEAELREVTAQLGDLRNDVISLLVPPPPAEYRDIILEVAAAVGGQESMLFAEELLNMYQSYAAHRGWRFFLSKTDYSETGGLRQASARVEGVHVYACMKHESGVHRVQRVPATESKGRMHTSTVAVAVLPIPTEIDVVIDPKDIQMTTKLASGAGGQHVQKIQSAVRLVHVPTGLVVECQETRTQVQNKALAMQRLRSRLYDQQLREKELEEQRRRKAQVGSMGRSEKIRTYNFQQDRVSDHRLAGRRGVNEVLAGGEELEDLHLELTRRQRQLQLEALLEDIPAGAAL